MALANVPDDGDEQYGGYDYSFTETVHDRYMCSICTKPLRDPHLTTCCGQHFCESCLTSWFKKHRKESCPHCRAEGKDFQHVLDKKLYREIKSLKIQCTTKKEGCNWEGELRSLDDHLKSAKGCGYVSVECPNKCSAGWREVTMMKRKDLDKHLKEECVERPYQCEHCGHKDTYGGITGIGSFIYSIWNHYNSCPDYPLSCPNECGANDIKRKDMKVHRSECPLEPVECPNKCDNILKLKRKELNEHLKECVERPYQCEYCGFKDTYSRITGNGCNLGVSAHYNSCLKYPLSCPNKCGASGFKRKDMKVHHSECPLKVIMCPNNCTYRLKQKDLIKHLKDECIERPYQCEHCGCKDTYFKIVASFGHHSTCPEYPLSCPNKCGASGIKRKDMEVHRSECPLEPVECPLEEAGCDVKLVRQQLETHVSEYLHKHLLMLMENQKRMVERQEKLTKEFIEMKQALSADVKILRTATSKEQTDTALASIQSHLGPSTSTKKLVNYGDQIVFRMPNFSRYKQSGKVWNSPPFYVCSHYCASVLKCQHHYKLCLAICAKGVESGESSHISISLYLLKEDIDGDDNEEEWPLTWCNSQLKVEVQNHLSPESLGNAVALPCECKGIANHEVLGNTEEFVSHDSIKNGGFVFEDTLLFKITLEKKKCGCKCHVPRLSCS